jgi:hypothetical protein
MRPPAHRRIRSVLATLRRCRTAHPGGPDCARARPALAVPLRTRLAVLAFSWRTGIQNPSSIWCPQLRGHEHHLTVLVR